MKLPAMESQFRSIIRQKIIDTHATQLPMLTRRDVWLPAVKGKATAVIGMRLAGKTNVGHALETAVLHELQRRGAQVNYVRTASGFEVDFYARGPAGDEALIQVCAELDSPDTLAREVRALQDAVHTWPNATLQLITLNQPKGGTLPPEIQLHLAPDWLL